MGRTKEKLSRDEKNQLSRKRYAIDPEYRARLKRNSLAYAERYPDRVAKKRREYASKYRKRNPEKILAYAKGYYLRDKEAFLKKQRGRQRTYNLKYHYGITLEDFNRMIAEQKGLCQICFRPFEKRTRDAVVDHCHETGEVRGILCRVCNAALGAFDDNPKRLRRAIDYLEGSEPSV